MTGFEPGSSGIASDCSANCATTTSQGLNLLCLRNIHPVSGIWTHHNLLNASPVTTRPGLPPVFRYYFVSRQSMKGLPLRFFKITASASAAAADNDLHNLWPRNTLRFWDTKFGWVFMSSSSWYFLIRREILSHWLATSNYRTLCKQWVSIPHSNMFMTLASNCTRFA